MKKQREQWGNCLTIWEIYDLSTATTPLRWTRVCPRIGSLMPTSLAKARHVSEFMHIPVTDRSPSVRLDGCPWPLICGKPCTSNRRFSHSHRIAFRHSDGRKMGTPGSDMTHPCRSASD